MLYQRILFVFSFLAIHFCSASQNAQFKLENYTPASPTAFQFLKYTEMPMSEFTGIPNISIPLYEIQEDGVSIPIALTYHAAGIRVSQEAGWVGLGWDLQLGSIVQEINDLDDYGVGVTRKLPDYNFSAIPQYFLAKSKITNLTATTGVKHSTFVQMAAWAYNENTTNADAQKATLGILQNRVNARTTYYGFKDIYTITDAFNSIIDDYGSLMNKDVFVNAPKFLKANHNQRFADAGMRSAIQAAQYVLTGGKDLSNGALQEHGQDFFIKGWEIYKDQQAGGFTWAEGGTFQGQYTPASQPAHKGTKSNSYKYIITASYSGNIYATFSDKYRIPH